MELKEEIKRRTRTIYLASASFSGLGGVGMAVFQPRVEYGRSIQESLLFGFTYSLSLSLLARFKDAPGREHINYVELGALSSGVYLVSKTLEQLALRG